MARSLSATSAAAMAVMMALVRVSMATNWVVGGPLGWAQNREGDPNFYQDWVQSNFPYLTTDNLEFHWHQGDSLMLVTQPDFATCNIIHPIGFWMNELSLVFPLSNSKNQRLYFISGANGHCAKGQKFFIDVAPAD